MAETLSARKLSTSKFSANFELRNQWTISFIIFGALLPDISLYIMFAFAQLTDVPNDVIWSEMYYSPFWQNLGAMSNSIPIFLMASLASWLIIQHSMSSRRTELARARGVLQGKHALRIAFAVLMVSLASLLHVATDLPLHHDDGHPHFWPFTNWIFSSPVSYWDATQNAKFWVPLECLLGLTLVVILWKRTMRFWTKGILFLAGLSYPVFAVFFFN